MRAALLIGLALGWAAAPAAAELAWLPNYEEAAKQSRESRQDLFVFVGGRDWSAASRAYRKGVLQAPALEAALGKDFLWLEVDHPDRPTADQRAAAAKNKGFEVVIRNYPGVALLDPEGRCYLRLEAPQGGAEGLLAAVRQARAVKARRDAALAAAGKASGAERARQLAAALELMGEAALQNGRHSHRALLDELKKADPQDAAGAQRRLTFSPDAFAEKQLWPLVGGKKYAEALALVDSELKDPRNSTRLKQHLLGLRFYVFQAQEKLDEAAKALQQIVQLDPATDLADEARGYLDNLTKPIVLAEAKWKPEHLRAHFAEWRLDVSGAVRERGAYEVEFRRTDGEGLTVRDVALVSGARELVKPAAPGRDGTVELEVPALPAGQKVWLRIAAKGQGWFGSRGDILIRKR